MSVVVAVTAGCVLPFWWLTKALGVDRKERLEGTEKWVLRHIATRMESCDDALSSALPDVVERVQAAFGFSKGLVAQLRERGVTAERVGWAVSAQIGAAPAELNKAFLRAAPVKSHCVDDDEALFAVQHRQIGLRNSRGQNL